MEHDLIPAAVEGLAISIKPMEGLALKVLATYGKVVSVSMVAVPLWITLGGPPTISQAPSPELDFPRHVASQSQYTNTHGPQVATQGGGTLFKVSLEGTIRSHARLLGAMPGPSSAT